MELSGILTVQALCVFSWVSHLAGKTFFSLFEFLEFFLTFLLLFCVHEIKSSFAENHGRFLKFVVKTALIWLVLGRFFCVFSQSETICNLHSCYKFVSWYTVCTRVTEKLHPLLSQSELSNFFVYIIIKVIDKAHYFFLYFCIFTCSLNLHVCPPGSL